MLHFIVIGNPINHSKSPEIHHAFGKQTGIPLTYERKLCSPNKDSFNQLVTNFFENGGSGANVTLPFKEFAFELCHQTGELSHEAKYAKAVNTLCLKDGKLYGDNTDGKGLVNDILSEILLCGNDVLIIGAGGAARGVIVPLFMAGVATITIANRTKAKAKALIANFPAFATRLTAIGLEDLEGTAFDVVINATSAGATNTTLQLPHNLKAPFVYDMMYGKPSAFLSHFSQQGVMLKKDGIGMLVSQAAYSFELWTGVDKDRLDLKSVVANLTQSAKDLD